MKCRYELTFVCVCKYTVVHVIIASDVMILDCVDFSVVKMTLTLVDLGQFSSLRSGNLSILFGMVHYLRFLLSSIGLKAACLRKCVATRLIISPDVHDCWLHRFVVVATIIILNEQIEFSSPRLQN